MGYIYFKLELLTRQLIPILSHPSRKGNPMNIASLSPTLTTVPGASMTSATPTIPDSSVRTSIVLPMKFVDGYETSADLYTFHGLVDGEEHIALGLGDHRRAVTNGTPMVRIHSECLTGDVFGSQRCDCGAQLREAVEEIANVGGYLLYLRQEGRGIGLYPKMEAYELQDQGFDTYAANRELGRGDDERDYTAAAQMLSALDVDQIDLLSNNPDKASQLQHFGMNIVRHVPTGVHVSENNRAYLNTKVAQHAHTIDMPSN